MNTKSASTNNNKNNIKVNIDTLKILCKSSQDELLTFLGNSLPKIYGETNCVVDKQFIFAKGELPICIVSHLDTVHSKQVKTIWYDEENGVLKSDEGIGGDDRCGVYASIALMNHYTKEKPSLLFTTDEEMGCVGAKVAATKLKSYGNNFKYLIEFDRKGHEDAVFYDTENDKFVKYIESFGFKKSHGSTSDIRSLSAAWDVASVNLSSGYYLAHTTSEYIKIHELATNISKAINMIDDLSNVEKFVHKDPDSVAKSLSSYYGANYKYNDEYYNETYGRYHESYEYCDTPIQKTKENNKSKYSFANVEEAMSDFWTIDISTYIEKGRIVKLS